MPTHRWEHHDERHGGTNLRAIAGGGSLRRSDNLEHGVVGDGSAGRGGCRDARCPLCIGQSGRQPPRRCPRPRDRARPV